MPPGRPSTQNCPTSPRGSPPAARARTPRSRTARAWHTRGSEEACWHPPSGSVAATCEFRLDREDGPGRAGRWPLRGRVSAPVGRFRRLAPSSQGLREAETTRRLVSGLAETPHAPVRTFLIADIRGYSGFTAEHGDEAAAMLVARFSDIVQESVQLRGGQLIEIRG